jgi:hypothetical protein
LPSTLPAPSPSQELQPINTYASQASHLKSTAMGEMIFTNEIRTGSQFRIDYPYYGLFGSAEILLIPNGSEVMFRCTLLNGDILFLRKLTQGKKWIDASLNRTTSLSSVIGQSIDDFLKNDPT